MLIVFIGGDDATRRFCTMRRHCPLYDENRGRWKHKGLIKEAFLNLPPRSFVLLESDIDGRWNGDHLRGDADDHPEVIAHERSHSVRNAARP